MRKTIILIMCLATMVLASCADDSPSLPVSPTTTPPATTVPDAVTVPEGPSEGEPSNAVPPTAPKSRFKEKFPPTRKDPEGSTTQKESSVDPPGDSQKVSKEKPNQIKEPGVSHKPPGTKPPVQEKTTPLDPDQKEALIRVAKGYQINQQKIFQAKAQCQEKKGPAFGECLRNQVLNKSISANKDFRTKLSVIKAQARGECPGAIESVINKSLAELDALRAFIRAFSQKSSPKKEQELYVKANEQLRQALSFLPIKCLPGAQFEQRTQK